MTWNEEEEEEEEVEEEEEEKATLKEGTGRELRAFACAQERKSKYEVKLDLVN